MRQKSRIRWKGGVKEELLIMEVVTLHGRAVVQEHKVDCMCARLLPAQSAAATAMHCCHDQSLLNDRSMPASAAQDAAKLAMPESE